MTSNASIIDKIFNSIAKFIQENKEEIKKGTINIEDKFIHLDTKELEKEIDITWRKELIKNNKKSKFSYENVLATFQVQNLQDLLKTARYKSNLEKQTNIEENILDTNFGNIYLNYRSGKVVRNFTQNYQRQIKDSIKYYIQDRNKVRPEGIKNKYDNSYIGEKELVKKLLGNENTKVIEKRDKSKVFQLPFTQEWSKWQYGLIDDIITGNKIYPEPYKEDIRQRVDRIIETELSAANNIGRLNQSITENTKVFRWNSRGSVGLCKLCLSLDNQILILNNINEDLVNKDFRKIKTKKVFNINELIKGTYFPPLHPYCNCYLSPIKSEKDLTPDMLNTLSKDRLQEVKNTLNNVNNNNLELGNIVKSIATSGIISGIVYGGIKEGYINTDYMKYISKENKEKEDFKKGLIMEKIGITTGIALLVFLLNKYKPSVIKAVKNEVDEVLEQKNINSKEIFETLKDMAITNQTNEIKKSIRKNNLIKDKINENEQRKKEEQEIKKEDIKEKIQQEKLNKKKINYRQKIYRDYLELIRIQEQINNVNNEIGKLINRLISLRKITDIDKARREASTIAKIYRVTIFRQIGSNNENSSVSLQSKNKKLAYIQAKINKGIKNYTKEFDEIPEIDVMYKGVQYDLNDFEQLNIIILDIQKDIENVIVNYNNIPLNEGLLNEELQSQGLNITYLKNMSKTIKKLENIKQSNIKPTSDKLKNISKNNK